MQDGPKVLDSISFHIMSGERIGIGWSRASPPSFVTFVLTVIIVVYDISRKNRFRQILIDPRALKMHIDGWGSISGWDQY
jgi:hypothetical protein